MCVPLHKTKPWHYSKIMSLIVRCFIIIRIISAINTRNDHHHFLSILYHPSLLLINATRLCFPQLIFLISVLCSSHQSFGAGAGQDYDNPKVKPSSSANAIYALAVRCVLACGLLASRPRSYTMHICSVLPL